MNETFNPIDPASIEYLEAMTPEQLDHWASQVNGGSTSATDEQLDWLARGSHDLHLGYADD